MVDVSRRLELTRFYAICHRDHRASQRVLEKAGFIVEASTGRTVLFPNLSSAPQQVASYVWPEGDRSAPAADVNSREV